MGTRNTAKLHHFVPQGHLRGFANDQSRLTVIPLDRSREPFTTLVKNVAAQTHFHTVPEADEPDAFEKALSTVEGQAIGMLRRLEGGEFPLPEEDRESLSFYFALLAVRGPDTRRTMEQMQSKLVRLEIGAGGRSNVKRWISKNLGFDANDEQAQRIWDQATQPGGPPITLPVAVHIEHMIETARELAKYIATRPWSLYRFDRRSLLICDAPVSLIRNPKDDASQLGVGFATAWGIAIPINRKLGLLMNDPTAVLERLDMDDPRIGRIRAAVVRGSVDSVEIGTTAIERLFNEHTAGSAREYIYCHPDDERFVPNDLHEPTLINVQADGLMDVEFDGEPWFPPSNKMREPEETPAASDTSEDLADYDVTR